MGHASANMTKYDQDGHTEKGIEYLEVEADLAFRGGGFAKVLQKFCKSQTTKKGPPFGEPF